MLVGWEAGSDTVAAMADPWVTPYLAWCPASRLHRGARTRSADPAHPGQRSHRSAWARRPDQPQPLDPHPSQQPLHPKGRAVLRPRPLDTLHGQLGGPPPAPGEQLGEVRVEHAELVAPGVAHDPEVKAALLLVVIAGRAQRLQATDLDLSGDWRCRVGRDVDQMWTTDSRSADGWMAATL